MFRLTELQASRMLLADWFRHFSRDRGLPFDQYGSDLRCFVIGDSQSFHVRAEFTDTEPFLVFVASDANRQSEVDLIASSAIASVRRRDLGTLNWYSATLETADVRPSSFVPGDLIFKMASQIRIAGWRRVGRDMLLEFTEEPLANPDPAKNLLAPKTTVRAHFCVPGPGPGHFGSSIASRMLQTAAALCTLALGRAVVPYHAFPARAEVMPELSQKWLDPQIYTLARRGIGLDILSLIALPGGPEIADTLHRALFTFQAAHEQEKAVVASILCVVAAESLTTPSTEWRTAKLTKRFISFLEDLMPRDLDTIIFHENFEATFGIQRGRRTSRALRRQLLEKIYDYRSGNLHEGISSIFPNPSIGEPQGAEAQRLLFMHFAESAILRFFESPRSSLVGHPQVKPAASDLLDGSGVWDSFRPPAGAPTLPHLVEVGTERHG